MIDSDTRKKIDKALFKLRDEVRNSNNFAITHFLDPHHKMFYGNVDSYLGAIRKELKMPRKEFQEFLLEYFRGEVPGVFDNVNNVYDLEGFTEFTFKQETFDYEKEIIKNFLALTVEQIEYILREASEITDDDCYYDAEVSDWFLKGYGFIDNPKYQNITDDDDIDFDEKYVIINNQEEFINGLRSHFSKGGKKRHYRVLLLALDLLPLVYRDKCKTFYKKDSASLYYKELAEWLANTKHIDDLMNNNIYKYTADLKVSLVESNNNRRNRVTVDMLYNACGKLIKINGYVSLYDNGKHSDLILTYTDDEYRYHKMLQHQGYTFRQLIDDIVKSVNSPELEQTTISKNI